MKLISIELKELPSLGEYRFIFVETQRKFKPIRTFNPIKLLDTTFDNSNTY